MKQCPQCRQAYSDETIFCLSDGTPLILFDDAPEEVTVFKPIQPTQEEITVFKPNREEITITRPSQNIQPTVPPVQSGSSPTFLYLVAGLLLLLIGGGVILAAIFVFSQMSGGNTNTEIAKVTNTDNGQNKLGDQQANLRQQQDQLEKEKERLANERKKLDEEKNKSVPTPPLLSTPPPPPTAPKPPQPTARIKFGRGNIAQSVSGKIYTQRSFVLEARSGQYLSASVSGGGCVTFSGGGTSTGFTTITGDNRLTLVNNCDKEAGFSMTVAIR